MVWDQPRGAPHPPQMRAGPGAEGGGAAANQQKSQFPERDARACVPHLPLSLLSCQLQPAHGALLEPALKACVNFPPTPGDQNRVAFFLNSLGFTLCRHESVSANICHCWVQTARLATNSVSIAVISTLVDVTPGQRPHGRKPQSSTCILLTVLPIALSGSRTLLTRATIHTTAAILGMSRCLPLHPVPPQARGELTPFPVSLILHAYSMFCRRRATYRLVTAHGLLRSR
jgi:hypothetical protein